MKTLLLQIDPIQYVAYLQDIESRQGSIKMKKASKKPKLHEKHLY